MPVLHSWQIDPSAFWAKVRKDGPGGCWLWTGRKHKFGYGVYGRGGGGRTNTAHRIVMTLTHGEIPDGMFVLHRCDVPACCNPDHLFFGTQRDNMHDMAAKGRKVCVPSMVKGSSHGMSKVTEEQADEIRRRYEAGGVYQRELGEEFGLHQTMVSLIVRRKNWRHVG